VRIRTFGVVLVAGLLVAALQLALAPPAEAAEFVVLKGGSRIELKGPWSQQGSNAILTRADGTVLSVPLTDIDQKATAAAKKTAAARPDVIVGPPQTPVEALRASRAVPKAMVRLTDADVSHDSVIAAELGSTGSGEKKEGGKGAARLDVAGYDQSKAGSNLILRGSLRNFGGTTANNSRMSVAAMDENGDLIASGEASLSKGNLEPFETVAFTATVPIGDRVVGSLRFSPQWIAAPPPATPAEAAAAAARPAGSAPAAAGAAAASPSHPPPPQPTPYGQGVLYAPPSAPAATSPPADSRMGYIPGASDPASQPKPPNL
jgi:hypothetical protein